QAGADVGEKVERLAQRQERGALRLLLGRELLPLWSTDGAEQDRVAAAAEFEGGVGQGAAVVVDPGAADVGSLVFQRQPGILGNVLQYAERLGHYLGADVVTRQDGKRQSRHGKSRQRGGGGRAEASRLWMGAPPVEVGSLS